MSETNRIEYKRELNNSLEKEVVAFLNSRTGGEIYIGIEDNGNIIGVKNSDSLQLKIKDRLKNNILPSIMGLFDVHTQNCENQEVVKITIASGYEKPYHLKKFGMSPRGCFLRVGTAAEPMTTRMIEELYARRTRNSIGIIESPRKKLTFQQLHIFYQEKGFDVKNNFAANLELLTNENRYNYAAYLLADENRNSIIVAKYAGKTKVDLIENKEMGYCSLIKTTNRVLDKLYIENRTLVNITPRNRKEAHLLHPVALREAVINAMVHNDYTTDLEPRFELFANRLEITSAGGLPYGFSEEEFFAGFSRPRNKQIMRIFHDLEIVEYLGSGVPRILQYYPKSIFNITENFIRIVIPFDAKAVEDMQRQNKNKKDNELVKRDLQRIENDKKRSTAEKIIQLIKENPKITIAKMAEKVDISWRVAAKHIKNLQQKNIIYREGSKKAGSWRIK